MHTIKIIKSKKKGLTLVEVIIAIFVFGVGILGVLKIMTQNIALVDNAKLISHATLLGKEAMELSFNHRDTNVLLAYNRECEERDQNIDSPFGCTNLLTSGNSEANTYIIQKSMTGTIDLQKIEISDNFLETFEKTRLYVNNQRYTHDTAGSGSTFARYISFQKVLSGSLSNKVDQHIIKVTTNTLYQKGSLTGMITLESLMGKRE